MTSNLLLLLQLSCYFYFISGISGSLFSFFAQKLLGPSTLFSHGKAATTLTKHNINNFYKWISKFTVSKHLFWHFYAFGLLSSVIFNTVCPCFPAALLAVQCVRRILECFWVMPGAKDSRMHLIHYLIGLSYYPALLLSFNLQQEGESKLQYYWIALFIAASLFQCYCHWILGSSRRNLVNKGIHRPLNHPIFKYIHTPHYFAELLIYTSIAGIFRFAPLSLLNLLWIVSILGVSAKNSADWLCDTWKYKSHKEFCKYLMIPFLF